MCIRDRILCAVRHGYLLQPSWSAATLPPSRPDGLEESLEASARSLAPRVPVLTGVSPHLRLQSDESLVALIRRGHQGAFEALLERYQPRLLAFCRHMLGSTEDAEDVLQEVFASAYR